MNNCKHLDNVYVGLVPGMAHRCLTCGLDVTFNDITQEWVERKDNDKEGRTESGT